MKNTSLLICLFFTISMANAQNIPTIKTNNSTLGLQDIDIKVEVVGNVAITTYDMLFYNPENRVLEGELSFPLGQNQQVTRFALDLNGTLRNAVIVEKEIGRVAFENTIRQKIDPALLEQTKGNNYKARIYPIPAKGTKRVVLSFQQELTTNEQQYKYHLPLSFEKKLTAFNLSFTVFDQQIIPEIETTFNNNFKFTKHNDSYVLKLNKKNYKANKSINIIIPNKVTSEKLIVNERYFYFTKTIQTKTKLKKKASKILLLWDVSLSMKKRDLEKELQVLDTYLKQVNNVTVLVKKFSNTIIESESFSINKGNTKALILYLKNSIYDGATSYNGLFKKVKNYDEILLFTDGLDNLGALNLQVKTPVYTVNSIPTSNHKVLNNLGTQSGGNYVNLNAISTKKAHGLLINEPFRFLGIKQYNVKKMAIYPNKITNVNTNFSIAGSNFTDNAKITLLFGYGNKVTESIVLVLKKSTIENKMLANLWAQKKLHSLTKEKEKNKEKIIALSKTYQIISPYTSLIILDRVEDYVRYKIEPPKELQVAYKRLLKAANEKDIKEEIEAIKEDLVGRYKDIDKWWHTNFKNKNKKQLKKEKKEARLRAKREIERAQNQNTQQQNTTNSTTTQQSNRVLNQTEINPNLRIIKGVVSDDMGPVSDISVIIKGSPKGTVTNFDGEFALNANEGDVLQFSHVSYNTIEKTIGAANNLNVVLQSNNSLEEVVIVAAPAYRRDATTSSVVSITQGKTAGVNINSKSGEPGASAFVRIRGVGSINTAIEPLYVVDGVLVNSTLIQSISADNIVSMHVLKGTNGTAIHGARGANGVIVITTKKGAQNKAKEITTFNTMLEDKLSLKGWDPKVSYMDVISKEKTIKASYKAYLKIRKKYEKQPTFYIDVSDYFIGKNAKKIALKILTNIAEIDISNYELSRAIAYKMEALGNNLQALYIYKELIKLRPEDIQTYRDLALCYQANKEYQKAFDLLFKIINGDFIEKDIDGRFEGIEAIAYVEFNHMATKYKKKLKIRKKHKKFMQQIKSDIRVVIDWNHNDTDIDLWVIDPNDEKCYYSHVKTKIGGIISEDMTEGFGPEEFLLKKAIKGDYQIKAKYFADNVQKISGPTILKVTIFKNYGMKNEIKKVKVYKLDNQGKKIISIGKITI